MGTALKNANSPYRITTIDLNEQLSLTAEANIKEKGMSDYVTFVRAEGAEGIRQQAAAGKTFGFAFIDHSHAKEHVVSACLGLPSVMMPGAPVSFHDFNDYRNPKPEFPVDGVIEGVKEAQASVNLNFRGICGCLTVYQYASAQSSSTQRTSGAAERVFCGALGALS